MTLKGRCASSIEPSDRSGTHPLHAPRFAGSPCRCRSGLRASGQDEVARLQLRRRRDAPRIESLPSPALSFTPRFARSSFAPRTRIRHKSLTKSHRLARPLSQVRCCRHLHRPWRCSLLRSCRLQVLHGLFALYFPRHHIDRRELPPLL